MGYSPWAPKESETTERAHTRTYTKCGITKDRSLNQGIRLDITFSKITWHQVPSCGVQLVGMHIEIFAKNA